MTNSTDGPQASEQSKKQQRRWLRKLIVAILGIVIVVVAVELVARYGFGLGNPPQYTRDPEIEYLPEPARSYRRFGRRITFNQWSMRSDEFPQRKQSADELRVLVLGDSIVNGGAKIDQDELATQLLQARLATKTGRSVVVGNISAPSWGVPNLEAYINRFGTFEADLALIVLNGYDGWDLPAEDSELPEGGARPTFAIEELAAKLFKAFQKIDANQEYRIAPANSILEVRDSLQRLSASFEASGTRVVVVIHFMEDEVLSIPQRETLALRHLVETLSLPIHQTEDAYEAAINASQQPLYFDGMHLTAHGQSVLVDVLFEVTMQVLELADDADAAAHP